MYVSKTIKIVAVNTLGYFGLEIDQRLLYFFLFGQNCISLQKHMVNKAIAMMLKKSPPSKNILERKSLSQTNISKGDMERT